MKAADILASLDEAHRAVAAGNLVDLSGLENAVERFCTDAATTEPAERQAAAAELEAVRKALDRLAGEIEASKTSGQAEAQNRNQAAKAYKPRKP